MTVALTSPAPAIVWFRQDLRLQDNRTLNAAVARGGAIIPVYIWDEAAEARWVAGGASRWWLHHSLAALDESLRTLGSRLILARGDAPAVLLELAGSTGATTVFWNRRYEPMGVAQGARVAQALAGGTVKAASFNSTLLREPSEITNQQGRPFQIFTAYWRHALTLPVEAPVKLLTKALPAPAKWPRSLLLPELELLPRLNWADGFAADWKPGEQSARARLHRFAAQAAGDYKSGRDRPDHEGTSRLSAHLHFGEIGPRQVWAAIRARSGDSGIFPPDAGSAVFLSEIGWREFAHHVLFHNPTAPELPMRPEFARFPWVKDPRGVRLRAWERGRTGYPIVDAGMRQLWQTGWMHNRVRMIVASFLVKHLRLPWTHGASWFWDTLVDADLANNTLGWQWSAGCGVDAAPYFRIFAPVLQGRKFDPDGAYVRRWVPELAAVSADWIHEPWAAPPGVLSTAGVRLGETYPHPLVDHATARNEALAAFKELRTGARP